MHVPCKVLTRRQQLGLAAEAKAAPGSKSGGRGRANNGKGRGGRKAKAKATTDGDGPPVAKLDPPVGVDAEMDEKLGKRGIESTPPKPKPVEGAMESSPPLKQPKKRAKASAKSKAKTCEPEPSKPSASSGDKVVEPPQSSKTEKTADKQEIKPKTPSQSQIKDAVEDLKDAKTDSELWGFVNVMFQATEKDPQACKDTFNNWSYSMYWNSKRVGLLQKGSGGRNSHVLSFGGTFCPHIGIPAAACKIYVGSSMSFKHCNWSIYGSTQLGENLNH